LGPADGVCTDSREVTIGEMEARYLTNVGRERIGVVLDVTMC
jgi:hypothetical protein